MKEKEWKKEQKIPLLPVEFPEDSVMQKECRAIVEKAIPKRQSLWERIKEIYWGPGIRAIFYQSGSIWLIVACLYLGIGWLGQLYAKQPETQRMIVFLGFPVCFLVFAALAWWLDAQNHMQERYYSSKPEEGSMNCTPNLEDVFLVTYQEEPA